MKATFTLKQDIAVVVDGIYHDLHNCFDFVGFEYRPEEQMAWLEWAKNDGHWVPDDAPEKIRLCFDGVTALVMTRRDPKMPFSEDTCVEHITFSPESCAEEFDAVFAGARFPDEHLSLDLCLELA